MEPRKRKRLLIGMMMIAAMVIGCVRFFSGDPEPTYNDRPLSYWIAEYGTTPAPSVPNAEREAAARAIQAIGTNAVPFLLEWLSYEPGRWRRKVPKLHQWVRQSGSAKPILDRWLYQSEKQAWNSVRALELLGPLASPVIPELHRNAWQAANPDVRDRALYALGYIGPAAVPAISNVLANAHPTNAARGFLFIPQLGTNAAPLVPLLASQLHHPDELVVLVCARALGEILLRPDHAVPALMDAMDDQRPNVRLVAIDALAQFGTSAESALLALTNALNDPNPRVRTLARAAIQAISRDVRP